MQVIEFNQIQIYFIFIIDRKKIITYLISSVGQLFNYIKIHNFGTIVIKNYDLTGNQTITFMEISISGNQFTGVLKPS